MRCMINCLVLIGLATSASGRHISPRPTPCCLPYRFKAVVTPLNSFNVQDQRVMLVARDWARRLQVQRMVKLGREGAVDDVLQTNYVDYKKKVQYVASAGRCQQRPVTYGMLEPCMPDKAAYLGTSFLGGAGGVHGQQTHFQTWHFRRTDKNRDVNMTVAVTSDWCIPVMERVQGRLGEGHTDGLLLFANLTRHVGDDAFALPLECADKD